MGLADGIGSINQILKNKFGENVKIKMIQTKKSFLQHRFSSSIDHTLIDGEKLIEKIYEKSLWSRYGL